MTDYVRSNAPDKKTLYLGDSLGNVYSAALLMTATSNNSDLKTADAIKTDINDGAVAALASSNTSPVIYMSGTV